MAKSWRLPVLRIVVLAGVLLGGCTRMLAERVVAAPNGECAVSGDGLAKMVGVQRTLRVKVGGGVTIAVWVLEPPAGPAKGTVFVLHGLHTQRIWHVEVARQLNRAGYRAVMVDLRGHGESTGKYLTFGVAEARDLRIVLDVLTCEGLAGERVGVYGISYGAATAIEWAGIDPRVTAVVAVAPFSTMAEEVPIFARHLVPVVGWCITDRGYAKIVAEAGKVASFDPAEASPLAAIRRTQARVLLIHGDWDFVIPLEQSQKLHAAAPEKSKLVILDGLGHVGAWFDPGGKVEREMLGWFGEYLSQRKGEPATQSVGNNSSTRTGAIGSPSGFTMSAAP